MLSHTCRNSHLSCDTSTSVPRYCLKVLALFRLANPEQELRIAGGRELHLGSMQCLGLYPANSIFVGDYLTTKGQLPESDYKMIEEMGFEISHNQPMAGVGESYINPITK